MTPYEKGFEDCKKQVKAAMVLAVENAILMEREACARLCDDWPVGRDDICDVAKAIRARWQK
jgi:hypothetical protein